MQHNNTLTQNQLGRMMNTIVPTWRIYEATPIEAGLHSVYRITAATPTDEQECYLKATPEGKNPSVDLEARLLAVLNRHSEIPVPGIYGVVDEHDELPAPFTLLEALPGEMKPRTELASVSDDVLQAIAYDTGQYLTELHSIDAADTYGFLTHSGPTLSGSKPSGDLDSITVADPVSDWKERLHDWADGTIQNLAQTRFNDIAPETEPVVKSRIDDIEGPFEPVLARTDHSLENLLFTSDGLSAMLDWEFTITSTPAYDLVNVIWSLAGGPYLFAPETPDRRDLIRESVLAGYRDRGDGYVIEEFYANHECYESLSALRSMVHLESWFQMFDHGGEIDYAASDIRKELTESL
ncbi:phosphotransferase family protein [Halococcus sp. IIIV-5B]|uniref:phosphotransferase family protein n=1 Tax=Halococcus sp. IIIV-5B TaxID=2321230 RepID=UPI000E70AFC1|nr:aminoglycoside phosphotransferase family protein [Halococcus sp. IIIV-5B]RJT03300.1 aminoglycoside phosphotransferase family protein [Halococcus sp. IIIV-5B]